MPVNIKLRLAFFWFPVFVGMGGIFYTSSIPGSNVPSLFPYQDLLYHFLMFFLLGLFFIRALKGTFPALDSRKVVVFTAIFVIIYALTDEGHQAFVPLRTVSFFDFVIDSLAGLAAGILFLLRQPSLSERKVCLK